MIDQQQAMCEAIRVAIGHLHQRLVLNGYQRQEALFEQLSASEASDVLPMAAGQNWTPQGRSPLDEEELLDRYFDSWATDIRQLSVISAEPYFDEQGRRQWAVVYQMAYGGYMITIMARMGPWLKEPLIEIEGKAIPTSHESASEGMVELPSEEVLKKVNDLIYSSITELHEIHRSLGYVRQKRAYELFVKKVLNGGYIDSDSGREITLDTHRDYGQEFDPDDLEEKFRQTWDLDLPGMSVLGAEYFPTLDGLDRWYITYQLKFTNITINVFVKYYPHRKPQVEVIGT